jgi:hypothetical protein
MLSHGTSLFIFSLIPLCLSNLYAMDKQKITHSEQKEEDHNPDQKLDDFKNNSQDENSREDNKPYQPLRCASVLPIIAHRYHQA